MYKVTWQHNIIIHSIHQNNPIFTPAPTPKKTYQTYFEFFFFLLFCLGQRLFLHYVCVSISFFTLDAGTRLCLYTLPPCQLRVGIQSPIRHTPLGRLQLGWCVRHEMMRWCEIFWATVWLFFLFFFFSFLLALLPSSPTPHPRTSAPKQDSIQFRQVSTLFPFLLFVRHDRSPFSFGGGGGSCRYGGQFFWFVFWAPCNKQFPLLMDLILMSGNKIMINITDN